jgi:phosphatidate phosphatase LPIN
LSGAIDVIVVEQENGSWFAANTTSMYSDDVILGDLACSPFHVRFGKFSLLRPYEKKVEFKVNSQKTDYAMKLGEGGEAFFVFETSGIVPEGMQTSPLVSPAASPRSEPSAPDSASEPDYLDIADSDGTSKTDGRPLRTQSDLGNGIPIVINPAHSYDAAGSVAPLSSSPTELTRPASGDWSGATLNLNRAAARSDEMLTASNRRYTTSGDASGRRYTTSGEASGPVRTRSPPPLDKAAAVERALALSRKLSISNIQTHITNRGDLMLDMHGYKLDQEDTLEAEKLARKILAEELDGDYDIGSLIGADRDGNLWIYSSEEAKQSADRQHGFLDTAVSDGGYYSDDAKSGYSSSEDKQDGRAVSTPPSTPPSSPPPGHDSSTDSKSYVKTLRLTSEQLKSLNLKPGMNEISFSVNRATCTANMYLWRYDVPVVISDIDGTITKSDALGHILTMVGRDWTHLGVAKLYTDIAANGYNILYLTSRSVGQADSTRNYLKGVVQDNYRLPKGPVIMSPDRTFHALRREVYLRKPEVFKMACLRDILNLFGTKHNPFYAGFGNRLTDALSYRSVNVPSTRIFTINSNAEVVLDLLCLTKYKSSYVNMRDLVDHFFPPVHKVVEEEYTDFNYWREGLMDPDEFTDSDAEREEGDDDDAGYMGDSYIEDDEEEYEEEVEEGEEAEEVEEGEDDDDEDGEYAEESDMTDSMVNSMVNSMVHEPDDEKIKQAQDDDEEEEVRTHGGMKNNLDCTRLQQAKEFVEHELSAIAEHVLPSNHEHDKEE